MARRSSIFVVWENGRVRLLVEGPTPPEMDELVAEATASLVESGVAPDDIEVVWTETPLTV